VCVQLSASIEWRRTLATAARHASWSIAPIACTEVMVQTGPAAQQQVSDNRILG
jgi:hypothetical protein